MSAKLIAINGQLLDRQIVPNECRSDQLAGTPYEQLMELAGRICYDSLNGKGRATDEYFDNILESEHYSILSHCYIAFGIEAGIEFYKVLGIEPGVFMVDMPFSIKSPMATMIVINLRALHRMAVQKQYMYSIINNLDVPIPVIRMIEIMADIAKEKVSPIVFKKFKYSFHNADESKFLERLKSYTELFPGPIPFYETYSFYVECSRNCSHELIRHNYSVGISQESTRYVDVSSALIIPHPDIPEEDRSCLTLVSNYASDQYKKIYDSVYDKTNNRKTARGAAARVLPHGVKTKLIMTFPAFVLGNLFKYRLDEHADSEIRNLAREMNNEVENFNKEYYGE